MMTIRPYVRWVTAVVSVTALVTLAACSSATDDVDDARGSLRSGQSGAAMSQDRASESAADGDDSTAGSAGGSHTDDDAASGSVGGQDADRAPVPEGETDLSDVEGVSWPQLFADVPLIDGEVQAAGQSHHASEDTKSQGVLVVGDVALPETGEQVRAALTDAGWTEQSYATRQIITGPTAHGVFTKDERGLFVQLDSRVQYKVSQVPKGSYGERQFVCFHLKGTATDAQLLALEGPLEGPVTDADVDFAFLGADGVAEWLPADLIDALDDLRAVVSEEDAGASSALEDAAAEAKSLIRTYCSS